MQAPTKNPIRVSTKPCPDGVMAPPSFMIGRSSGLSSPNSPSHQASIRYRDDSLPDKRLAVTFHPVKEQTGTLPEDNRTNRVWSLCGSQHRPLCGGFSPPSLFIRLLKGLTVKRTLVISSCYHVSITKPVNRTMHGKPFHEHRSWVCFCQIVVPERLSSIWRHCQWTVNNGLWRHIWG